MKRFFIILVLLPFLFACKKGAGEFTLEGVITDESFSNPLIGATVTLYSYGSSTNQENVIAQCTTTSDGKYSFVFPREPIEKYVLKIEKAQYFTIEEDVFYSSLHLKEINTRNLSTTAKSWVEIRIINNAPSINDHLQFIRQQGKSGCSECCLGDLQHFYGPQNTSIYCINDGNKLYSVEYAVSGTSNTGILGVVTIPFDTTELLISY